MRYRVRIGDVIEVPTKLGLAYAQCTHQDRQMGAVLRVLKRLHKERPSNMADVVMEKHRFQAFFPLKEAVSRRIFEVVANEEVPEEARERPVFRSGLPDPVTGRVLQWCLWDGEKEWYVKDLDAEERQFPLSEVINDTSLIERIETEWSPDQVV